LQLGLFLFHGFLRWDHVQITNRVPLQISVVPECVPEKILAGSACPNGSVSGVKLELCQN
jgi:hypothetical protein